MNSARLTAPILAAVLILGATTFAWAQAPPPPAPPRTLWSFLGVPQTYKWAHAQVFNRFGNHPRLERRPPLLPLSAPANLESPIPAIKAAAEIKLQEDLAPQKIKAIKYLAWIGCGCYDQDGKITEALLAAMEDCTEDVRLAAVEAVAESAANKDCGYCHTNCCCGEKIVEALAKIAYERDEQGCWLEPSERVRAAAIEALAACCPDRGPLMMEGEIIEGEIVIPEVPEDIELPEDAAPPPPAPNGQAPPPPTADTPPPPAAARHSSRRAYQLQLASQPMQQAHREAVSRYGAYFTSNPHAQAAHSTPAPQPAASTQQVPANVRPIRQTSGGRIVEPVRGHVAQVNASNGLVYLHLDGNKTLAPQSRVKVYHQYVTGREMLTELVIIESRPGMASAKAINSQALSKLARGDEVIGLR